LDIPTRSVEIETSRDGCTPKGAREVDVSVIQVPYHAGDDRHPSSAGPRRLLDAGAIDLLAAQGHRGSVELVGRGGPFRDSLSSSAAVNRQVARRVRAATEAGRFPLVLAGSCVTCQRVLGGFDHTGCGAVWLDAHADFKHPGDHRQRLSPAWLSRS
jgi:arginase